LQVLKKQVKKLEAMATAIKIMFQIKIKEIKEMLKIFLTLN
jgi:hypothetical protein